MTAKDIGFKCENCGALNKYLQLDIEFGKRREIVECGDCNKELQLEDQQKLYSEKQLVKVFARDIEMYESELTGLDEDDEAARSNFLGRMEAVNNVAKMFSLRSQLQDMEGLSRCIYCGKVNSDEAPRCEFCGRADYDEVEASQA